MDKEQIKQFILSNSHLVQVKIQAPGKIVLKYKRKVFYKALWTPELCEMRGTVVDENFDIVQRPFTKIFNVGEKNAPYIEDNLMCIASQKINGFMGAATWHDGSIFVSTTGSINSEFADMVLKHVVQFADMFRAMDNYTFIFEIVDPSDPHVITEVHGPYLVGARVKRWSALNHGIPESTLDNIARTYGIMRPQWHTATFGNIMKGVRNATHEGYVIYSVNDRFDYREVKVKTPYYLATKFLGRKNEKRLNEILDDPQQAKQILDEEFYVVVEHLATMKDEFVSMKEQERFAYLREYFTENVIQKT